MYKLLVYSLLNLLMLLKSKVTNLDKKSLALMAILISYY